MPKKDDHEVNLIRVHINQDFQTKILLGCVCIDSWSDDLGLTINPLIGQKPILDDYYADFKYDGVEPVRTDFNSLSKVFSV